MKGISVNGEADGKEVLSLDRTCISVSEAVMINTGIDIMPLGEKARPNFCPVAVIMVPSLRILSTNCFLQSCLFDQFSLDNYILLI